MEQLKKVEKLREKADLTYEDAKKVLEECEWDLLDAVLKLEAQGRLSQSGDPSFSTEGTTADEAPKSPQQIAESYQTYQETKGQKEKHSAFRSLWNGIKLLCRKSCENQFVVKRHGRTIMDIPVLFLVILMLASFWTLLIIMLVGLFFGFSYSFSGPELGKESINDVMEKASQTAEDLKTEFKEQETKNRETEETK